MKLAHVLTCFALALGFCSAASAQTARVPVVAAENFTATSFASSAAITCR